MDKKTIGKFISALRRANGMTQKELGEKLYVSDKAISRWERDECLPELSLIPTIAEIFGITTDELLRGERKNPENEFSTLSESKHQRSEKQFKLMLHQNEKKFSNLSLISVGLIFIGIIVAALCNGFYISALGGLLSLIFYISATICQICFTNAFSITDYEDEHQGEVKTANAKQVNLSVKVIFAVIAAFLFTSPLLYLGGWHYGVNFADTWLPQGLVLTIIGFIISFSLYRLVIQPALIKNGVLNYSEKDKDSLRKSAILLKKSIRTLAIIIAAVIIAAITNLIAYDSTGYTKVYEFETMSEAKEFLENQYDEWLYEGYGKTVRKDKDGFPIGEKEKHYGNYESEEYFMMILEYDKEGNFQYYHNPDLNYIENIYESWNESHYRITTKEDFYTGMEIYETITAILIVIAILSTLGASGYYIYKSYIQKQRQNKSTVI